MAHTRKRLAFEKLLKRLKFSPVVAIQGARQTGKSVLAQKLLAKEIDAQWVSFDQMGPLQLCRASPETFLAGFNPRKLLIIDEAQKASNVFDAVKFAVDQDRRPGRFLLLGSTEFSHLQQIRESLTGRLSRIRLFPLVYRELSGQSSGALKVSRRELLKYLDIGGMPAIAFARDAEVRMDLLEDWIQLTCQRDIHQFKRLKLDSDLAFLVLKATATLEEPTLAAITRSCRTHSRRVQSHLQALQELFCVIRLNPHPSGAGKPLFLPLDPGVVGYFGASLMRRLHIALLNERMAHNQYFGSKTDLFFYYRSTGKTHIHLIEESVDGRLTASQLIDREALRKTDMNLLNAFGKKSPKATLQLMAPVTEPMKMGRIHVLPWEKICL